MKRDGAMGARVRYLTSGSRLGRTVEATLDPHHRSSPFMDTFEPRRHARAKAVVATSRAYDGQNPAALRSGPAGEDDSEELESLARNVREGDREALHALFALSKDRIYRTALLLLSNRHAAEAVTEQVFVDFYQGRPDEAFVDWSYRRLASLCLHHMVEEDADAPRERLSVDMPDRGTAIRRRIAGALAGLPPGARIAFVLRESQGMSYDRIADIMQLEESDIAHYLHAARAGVAGVLEEIEFDARTARNVGIGR